MKTKKAITITNIGKQTSAATSVVPTMQSMTPLHTTMALAHLEPHLEAASAHACIQTCEYIPANSLFAQIFCFSITAAGRVRVKSKSINFSHLFCLLQFTGKYLKVSSVVIFPL